jgi:transglutaminase-like putative cysteine protease
MKCARKLTTAEDWARFLSWTLELLALGALAGTSEVSFKSFVVAGVILIVSQFFQRGLHERWIVGFLLTAIIGTFIGWRVGNMHPIVAVTHAVPIAHSFLWFAPPNARYRGWRLGMGMVELILASTLSAEAYLPLAIVVFLIVGAVALSCNFLDSELRREAPSYVDNPLPKRFIRQSLGLSLLLVASSVVIFPILPRTQTGLQMFGTPTQTGYTEGVRIENWHTFDTRQTGSVILRLYPPSDTDLMTEIYLGLLRGRVLDQFDGKEWKAADNRRLGIRPSLKANKSKAIVVDGVREPIRSDVMPVPYGTSEVSVSFGTYKVAASRSSMSEWVGLGSTNRRTEFSFEVHPNDLTYLRDFREIDRPLAIHSKVPAEVATDAMKREAAKIFAGTKTTNDKIQRVMAYFANSRFTVGESGEELQSTQNPNLRKLSGLEEFLFVRRAGHCEWFASAAAVLLRLDGAPTRMIAGFRLGKAQVGGVLTVRNSDAHAWIEVWHPERGWVPLDPTPRLVSSSPFEFFSDAYDLVSAYWFKYVVSYDMGDFSMEMARSLRQGLNFSRFQEASLDTIHERKGVILWIVGVLLAFGATVFLVLRIWFPQVFSIRWRVSEGPPALRRERLRMEKLLKRHRLPDLEESHRVIYSIKGVQAGDLYSEWLGLYQTARFGRASVQESSSINVAQQLSNQYIRFKRSVTN